MKNYILQSALSKNWDNTFKVNTKLLIDANFSYKEERDLEWVFSPKETYLVPLTTRGNRIVHNTFSFINDLIRNEKEIEEVILEHIRRRTLFKKQIDDFYEIIDAYKKLDVFWLNGHDDILVFNKIEEYKCVTKIQIYSLAKLEILFRILNRNFTEEDIKKLKDDNYTPFIFPIKEAIDIGLHSNRNYEYFKKNFYTLSDLIFTGHLKLNNYR